MTYSVLKFPHFFVLSLINSDDISLIFTAHRNFFERLYARFSPLFPQIVQYVGLLLCHSHDFFSRNDRVLGDYPNGKSVKDSI